MTSDDAHTRFQALFEAHRVAIFAYARRRVDADAAADVVADTFLVAWRRLDAVPDDALPWLYGVARKVVANQLRAARRADALVDRLVGDHAAAAEHVAHACAPDPRVLALHAALARLGERDREALRLVAWEGLDAERAARAAGCTRATFAVRLHRARRRLAAAMSEERAAAVSPLEVPREA